MYRKLIFILGIVLLSSFASADLNDNIVAYYTYDDGVEDSVNSNDGNNQGTTEVSGKIGNARSFDGTNDYIRHDTAQTDLKQLGDFTLQYWIKTSVTANDAIIKSVSASGNANPWNIKIDSGYLYIVLGDGNGQRVTYISTPVNYDNNAWHHVILVKDGTTPYIYFDGSSLPVTNNFIGQSITDGDVYTYIGVDGRTGLSNYFTGQLDEIAVWSRAISSDEVTELWNDGDGLQYPFTSCGGCDYCGTGDWIISESCHVTEDTTLELGYKMIVKAGYTVWVDSGVTIK